ncbi:Ankyrin repeat and KH domain-containing protein 1 [Fusarium oxysporum f. sp. raphani]|uniref:Ankyrin repeat and KH domain-containing protein 1 n=1 Tax=Fusarium oxysporum f. sp. raphani TaxID=96318 RepID=A0A8J5P9A1_FUSOX|nr:Ankyrin repeat and KH domain-containing protein 1 [Fusarium oxysporum f. sp. raphani]
MANPQDYTVGWICALTVEFVAAQAFLDEEHKDPRDVAQNDNNNYALGRIGSHNIVIAVLPDGEYGTAVAAAVARDMLGSFPNIRIGLLVGIGGGAPSPHHDIRLGDIVVSSRDGGKGGVFQYDFGKTIQNQSFQETQVLDQPPMVLRTAVSALKGRYELKGHRLNEDVDMALKKIKKRKKYSCPPANSDRLYRAAITHPPNSSESCSVVCGDDPFHLLARAERDEEDDNPAIHYGLIASANQLMKDALVRDKLAAEMGVLCFEMEAAGLMNHFPCLVIRGICDYSDSHKNKEWQGFAAMVAAAYAKDLLRQIPPNKVEAERRIGEVLSSIGTTLNDVQQTTNATKDIVETVRSNQHVATIKDWLSPPDYSTNANHARHLRHEGTGEWFLNSAAFREWETGSRRHLWLYGMPGCGKTVLGTTILDHLMNIDDHITLDFFFDFSDTTKQTVDGMLRSLVFQLYKLGIDSSKELDGLFQSHRDGRDQPATKTLLGCLRTMMRVPRKICLVLDGLDESTTRVELLKWMKDVLSAPELDHVRLIATGRPEAEFQRGIPPLIGKGNCLLLDKDAINADIRSYVMARLERSPEFARWASSPSVLEQIRNKIGSKPDGMQVLFRWAACQLDSLETCLDREGIETALKSLPQDLNETYNRLLQRIPPERKHKAIRLLQFLVCSERPLTLKEAVDVVAVRIDSRPGYFDPEDRLPCPSEITRFCPSLVSIVHGPHSGQGAVEEVQLAHFSVKEYLLNYQVQGFLHAEASIAITQTCLAYLNSLGQDDVAMIKSQFPLAKYAAEIWMDHAGPAEVSKDVVAAAVSFLENDVLFRLWTRLYQPDKPWLVEPETTQASCLYFASFAALTKTVRVLLLNNRNVDEQGGYYGNALEVASLNGDEEIVRRLLDEEADVNAQGGSYGSALRAASDGGHVGIVRLLLDEEADVNAQGGHYGNALQAASDGGHVGIVRMLLDEEADVNAQGGLYGNALQAASIAGDKEIVRLLLEKKADVNAQGGYYGSALQAASEGDRIEIARMLLDKEADVNAQGGYYGNALQAAYYHGHEEMVLLLVNAGHELPPPSKRRRIIRWYTGKPPILAPID